MSKILPFHIEAFWQEAETSARLKVHPNGDVTMHINHDGCPAGVDTRRRLYLTEEAATGTILAYCHNCGGRGYLRKRESVAHVNKELGLAVPSTPLTKAGLVQWTPARHPKGAKDTGAIRWLSKYLSAGGVNQLSQCVGFDPDEYATLCIESQQGQVIGVQARALGERPTGPRYTTYRTPLYSPMHHGETMRSWYLKTNPAQWPLVICEDIVSAIRVRYDVPGVHVSSMALLGSHMSNQDFLAVAKLNPTTVHVMLDNDNPTVIKEATRIGDMFDVMGISCNVHKSTTDPKNMPTDLLRDILKGT